MSCCQNQRVLRTSTGTGTQNKLVLLVLQKKSNPRKPQNVDKYGFLPLRLKNQRGCFWSTLRAKTWHVAQLGHIKWDKVSFQAVFHLSVIVKHPSIHYTSLVLTGDNGHTSHTHIVNYNQLYATFILGYVMTTY